MKPWRKILRDRWSELASAMCSSCRTTCSSATASVASDIHMAWLNTGGVQGYNSAAHASSMLEMLGVPYVGHDPLAATTLDNKHAFKREAVCAGIPTAAFSTWNMARGPFRPELNSQFKSAFGDYAGPFIVKPVSGRASLHVHVAEDRAALPGMVETIYQATENVVLIEKYLSGREFCIGVAGPVTSRQRRLVRGGEPFTLSAIERVFEPDEKIFTSMDARPITNDRLKKLDPVRDGELLERMRLLACEIYREFNLSSLIRLDLRSDEHGNLHVLEANPKPDLKQPAEGVTSLISAGLSECGMDYDDLIFSLIADRLDYLFTHRREAVRHILDLLEPGASEARHGDQRTGRDGAVRATGRFRRAHQGCHVRHCRRPERGDERASDGRRDRADQCGRCRDQPARTEILVSGIGRRSERGARTHRAVQPPRRNRARLRPPETTATHISAGIGQRLATCCGRSALPRALRPELLIGSSTVEHKVLSGV